MSGDYNNYSNYDSRSFSTLYGNGYSPWTYDGPGVSNYDFGIGSNGASQYNPYQIQSPSFSQGFSSPNFTAGQIDGGLPNLTAQDYSSPQTEAVTVYAPMIPQTESVTVGASPASSYQIQTPTFSPGFLSPNFTAGQISAPPPLSSPEEVTVEAFRPPDPQQVQITPNLDPANWAYPPITPNMYPPPVLPTMARPNQPKPKNQTRAPAGGSGGFSPPPKQPQRPPQQPPQQPRPLQQQPQPQPQRPPAGVTQQQMNALGNLTPAQLRALLNNPNLTPQQLAAVRQMLGAKNQAAMQVARGGGSAGQQQAAAKAAGAASPASPLQPFSFALPLLIAAGVATAWGLAHPRRVQEGAATVRRRVRRVLN